MDFLRKNKKEYELFVDEFLLGFPDGMGIISNCYIFDGKRAQENAMCKLVDLIKEVAEKESFYRIIIKLNGDEFKRIEIRGKNII